MIKSKVMWTLAGVALLSAMILPAHAATVEMLNKDKDGNKMVYSQEIVNISSGDTVTWVATSKGHNVEFKAGPDGWKAPKKSKRLRA